MIGLFRKTILLNAIKVPDWLKNLIFLQDKWIKQYDIEFRDPETYRPQPFDISVLSGCQLHESMRQRLCLNNESKEYIEVGKAYSFPDADDNPTVKSPSNPARLLWDPSSPTPKLLVQLSPYFPPALWIPVAPSSSALARLFSETIIAETAVADREASFFREIQTKLQTQIQRDYREADIALLYETFIDAIRNRDPSTITLPHPVTRKYLFGHVPDVETVETSFLRNPFVSCWPVVLGERNFHQGRDGARVCVFRSLISSAYVGIETREDLLVGVPEEDGGSQFADAAARHAGSRSQPDTQTPHTQAPHPQTQLPRRVREQDELDREVERYVDTRMPAYLIANYLPLRRLCGGGQLILRYNDLIGTAFAPDTPVDVVAASIPALPQSARSVTQMLEGMLQSLDELQTAYAAAVAHNVGRKLGSSEVQAERRLRQDLAETVAATATFILHLAIMRDPHGEWDRIARPLRNHPRSAIRLAVAKGAAELGDRKLVEEIANTDPNERNRTVLKALLDEWNEDSDHNISSSTIDEEITFEQTDLDEPIDLEKVRSVVGGS